MKVLHLYNLHRFRGGADRAALSTIDLLRAEGLDVRTLAYDSQALARGVRGRLSAFTSGIYSRAALQQLDALLDSFQPDVVHAHKLYPFISPWALRLCNRRGFPVVMSVYDYSMTCPVGTNHWHGTPCTRCMDQGEHWGVIRNCRGRVLESTAYALRHAVARRFHLYRDHVSRFVTPTTFSKHWLSQHAGVPADRVVTIPLSFDLPEVVADPARGTYFGFVGRFAPEKGIATMLEAAHRTGLPFRLAGDAAQLRLADGLSNVKLIVTRTRGELMEFYRGARALIVPSLWFETFPLVIGEAMSHGIPVIASRIGGLPELVSDGATGLLAEPGNAADLARQVRSLWDNPEIARRLGAAARAYIESTCHKDIFCKRLRAVYAELCR